MDADRNRVYTKERRENGILNFFFCFFFFYFSRKEVCFEYAETQTDTLKMKAKASVLCRKVLIKLTQAYSSYIFVFLFFFPSLFLFTLI